jgi:oligopeptidase B
MDTLNRKFTILVSNEINPGSIYEYDLGSGVLRLMHELEIPGFDKSAYSIEHISIPGDSNIKIPLTLLYRKEIKSRGSRPLILCAYGAYGNVFPVEFEKQAISFLDRGFYVALAAPRGGGEMGEEWWNDGRLLNKKNTFKDYFSCADYLIERGYTAKGEITGLGGSAGGLIMGYAANERPELFKSLCMGHPYVDPLSDLLDSTENLKSPNEWLEFGNPNINTFYDYIQTYAPYNNVRKHDYPAILMTTGLLDNNLNYSQAVKMVAMLRHDKTDHNILLLYVNKTGTHFGDSGIDDYLRGAAKSWAFILDQYGINK